LSKFELKITVACVAGALAVQVFVLAAIISVGCVSPVTFNKHRKR
jgi:hypothetical protein